MATQDGQVTMGGARQGDKAPVGGEGAPAAGDARPARPKRRAGERAKRRPARGADRLPDGPGAPTPERAAKGPVVRIRGTIADSDGKIAQPLICSDTLDVMERRGTITRRMHIAAAQFRQDFRVSNMDPARAAQMLRAGGGGDGATITERQEAARRRVRRALAHVGGRTSPAGSVIWAVVGEERTLKDWAGTREKHASGILVGALCALASYYGY